MDNTQTPNQDEKYAQNGLNKEIELSLQKPVIICKHCKKEVPNTFEHKRKYFCNRVCCALWHYHNDERVKARVKLNAKRSRERYKDNPEFKKRNVEKFLAWRANHLQYHNETMKLYMRKKFKEVRAEGLCFLCRKVKSEKAYCPTCIIKRREQKNERAKQILGV